MAASCSARVLRGRRDISSGEVVTGPQQSWQPGTHSNEGICCRNVRIVWLLQLIEAVTNSGIERDSDAKAPIQTAAADQCCPSGKVRLMLRQVF
ncbi:hypothetical protein D3C85_1501800 [compost metagenome]